VTGTQRSGQYALVSSRARSVYELRVAQPTSKDRRKRGFLSFIGEMVASREYEAVGQGPYVYVTIEVLDRDSGVVVRTWAELPVTAAGLAQEIESDLDRLDADSFASKWKLQPPSSN
jgi:hypothetical protein